MSEEFEAKFIKPIVNACYPGTLAALGLAVLQITTNYPLALKIVLLTSSLTFTLSAFFIFFYTLYPTRKRLWTLTAITFLFGLCCSILAALMLFYGLLDPPMTG
jgi:ABC-type Fe3+-siderophore transport system permease subunit